MLQLLPAALQRLEQGGRKPCPLESSQQDGGKEAGSSRGSLPLHPSLLTAAGCSYPELGLGEWELEPLCYVDPTQPPPRPKPTSLGLEIHAAEGLCYLHCFWCSEK